MFKKTVGILVVGSMLTSCASIINGTSDRININSMEPDTILYVDGLPRGRDHVEAEISRKKRHHLRATKEGCDDVIFTTSRSYDLTSLLGILLDFGIVSLPLDFILGGALKADPTIYTVTPICHD